MKILVIDDSTVHLKSAKEQLGSHDLTVVNNFDDAQKLLGGGYNSDKRTKTNTHDFDVVLTDLMMPASAQYMGNRGSEFVGQEMSVGIFLALLAAKNGAKFVGVLTDGCHHDHPAIACFDAFNSDEDTPDSFRVADASVTLCNGNRFAGGGYKQWGEFFAWIIDRKKPGLQRWIGTGSPFISRNSSPCDGL